MGNGKIREGNKEGGLTEESGGQKQNFVEEEKGKGRNKSINRGN